MNILFKYATRGRPMWFRETLKAYYTMMQDWSPHTFLVSMDVDDITMNNNKMIEFLKFQPRLHYCYGRSRTKIEAINADMEIVKAVQWDILVVVSDDMIPAVEGFEKVIITEMEKHFPDTDGALHFDDGCCGRDRCITLSILGRKLYDSLGYIYHPDYKSFYCDNEFTDVVRQMKKVVYIPQVIIKHDWKGGRGADDVYRMNTKKGSDDENTYRLRKSAGFPKKGIKNVQST